jgi:hypothetical protein
MPRPLSNLVLALLLITGFVRAETVPKLDFDKVDPRKMLEKDRTAERCLFYESKKQREICAFGCFNATLRDYVLWADGDELRKTRRHPGGERFLDA